MHAPTAQRAVILVSGGLDSATLLAIARAEGRACVALSADYGQRHRAELGAAARVARALAAERHVIVKVDLRAIGGSALTDDGIDVPGAGARPGIPITYVPARNMLLLSLAFGLAEVEGAGEVWLGANAVDFSGYPDCRAPFLESFEACAALGTKAGAEGRAVRLRAPLVEWTKAEIIRQGAELGVDYSMTVSCYSADEGGEACGACDSCRIRREGFERAGVTDPTRYARTGARGKLA